MLDHPKFFLVTALSVVNHIFSHRGRSVEKDHSMISDSQLQALKQ